jgi:uncharacterized FAD-dependent dehydrogenase
MPILLRDIRLDLDEPEEHLLTLAAKRLGVDVGAIRTWAIVRRSLDARKRAGSGRGPDRIQFSYHIELALNEPIHAERKRLRRFRRHQASWIEPRRDEPIRPGKRSLVGRPTIVGFGPAGMFAALKLARMGYRPVVYERGREVRRRSRDIMQRFYREGDFDPNSNLLFGEGGAGTYSDGKLHTRISDPRARTVLEELYRHEAHPDILIDARPHVGSDRLPAICARIRETIETLGGEVHFDDLIKDLEVTGGRLGALRVRRAQSQRVETVKAGPTILAIGHSARDTMRMLLGRGVLIEPKPFQLGVRIEHPQERVDRWQYGDAAGHPRLGPAEYHVVAKGASPLGGDMFSFCMCPGGMILPANETPGLIVTNGASRAGRAGPFASSGLVITITPETLGSDPLAGIAFQEKWERRAFEATDQTYQLPAQRASDYLGHRNSDGTLDTSYPLLRRRGRNHHRSGDPGQRPDPHRPGPRE